MSRRCLSSLTKPLTTIESCSRSKSYILVAVASSSRQNTLCQSSTPSFSPRRTITSSQTRTYAAPTLKFRQSNISVEEYQKLSDQVFDNLTDYLEELVENHDAPYTDDFEIEYYMGVLNLRLGDHGTYVINKQPANKQIWFSSPSSGPKRFDYDKEQDAWFMLKEGQEWNMRDTLNRELSQIFDKEVKVKMGDR